jgi:cupin 2 domain-containing protein
MKVANLLASIASSLPEEQFELLVETSAFKLERIVSTGHATPPKQWYDQERDEWVVLLAGSAGLLFEGESAPRVLRPGDYVRIPAHRRHRVEWTDGATPTVWLALHYCSE